MAQITGLAEWHINSTEPSLLDYRDDAFFDPDTPWSASDHDPLLVGLSLTSDADTPLV